MIDAALFVAFVVIACVVTGVGLFALVEVAFDWNNARRRR